MDDFLLLGITTFFGRNLKYKKLCLLVTNYYIKENDL